MTAGPSTFAGLGLDGRLVGALTALGYEEPTPVQARAIPPLLSGRDVLAQAATGTGKTAAFALPLLHRRAVASDRTGVFGLVLVPTRELAMQVSEAVHKYGRELGTRVVAVYGGSSMGLQLRALERGVDVVVATPGRALDHIRRGSLDLSKLATLVLDEADEMLDMGFAEELDAILEATPSSRQTALFSATMPPRISSLAKKHLRDADEIRLADAKAGPKAARGKVRQVAYVVPRAHKKAALARILDVESPASAIVFCRTRTEVDEITETLASRGVGAEALHGGFAQEQRDRVLKRFRSGTTDVLVATDVAARGLDVEQVSHVVNFDVPSSSEAYVHRIGRTGRAGREGTAVTLLEPREHFLLRVFERATGGKVEVASLPTVADLRARRLELTRTSLREALVAGGLETFRVAVESLAEEFDVLDIAAAGVKLAHAASGAPESEEEIPTVPPPRPFEPRPFRQDARDARPGARGPAASRGPRPGADASHEKRPQRRAPAPDAATLFVGAGRNGGVRPADLFGAITAESGLPGRAIGFIEVADRFSLVEVPAADADRVIEALRKSGVRGRKVVVRRERDER